MIAFANTVNPRCFAAGRLGSRTLRNLLTGEHRTIRFRALVEYRGVRIITCTVVPTPTPVAP